MRLLRRIRGIVGTALTWATGWGILGAVVSALAILASGPWDGAPVAGMIFLGALFLATYGFIAGLVFSLVVLAAERRRTLHQLTLPRVPRGAVSGASSWLPSRSPPRDRRC